MKRLEVTVFVVAMALLGLPAFAQKGKVVLHPHEVSGDTHFHVSEFPKDMVLPAVYGWGGLAVDLNNSPAGADFRPLLVGLENDHCQVPHWGYVIEGAILIEYEDGTSDTFRKGEVFYMRPGHTGEVLEDLKLVSFSPEQGMHDLTKHLEKKVAEMQGQ
jgi:hypothetical protein